MRLVMMLLYSFRLKWLYRIHNYSGHCGYGMIVAFRLNKTPGSTRGK